MTKKVISLLLALSLVTGLFYGDVTTFAADNEVILMIKGEAVESDVTPYINDDGRTMVLIRVISENLDATVTWDGEVETVIIERGDMVLVLTIDASTYLLNDEAIELDSPAVIVDGRTMVPVRVVSEAMGEDVEWDEETNTVTVTPAGGYQTYGSEEPDDNWKWVTGEEFDYTNWAVYYAGVAQYENMRMPYGYNYGFVIEYDSNPAE